LLRDLEILRQLPVLRQMDAPQSSARPANDDKGKR
jgi:hypothetical protein